MATALITGSRDAESASALRAAQAVQGVGLGELLKGARERRGLTLQQISQETKIPRRHLEALEHDDLAVSPGAFYRRAEVRAYAQAVHLDQHLALAQLDNALETSWTHSTEAEPSTPRRLPVSRAVAFMLAGTVVLAVAVGRTVGGRERSSNDRIENVPVPPAVTSIHQGDPKVLEPEVPGLPPDTPTAPTVLAETPLTSLDRDPAASDTELVVLTEPPGASVTVNGVGWGTAPVTIRYLPPGEKRVRVSRDGYAAEERIVPLTSGRPATVEVQLSNQP